ncbi:hypothetical protein L9F63_006760 [Diploptera punctata]|uniref:NACHT domain-containing protein n=1 Tax=Diploptera punctata TaxID=6984 RepID=A0AAD8E4E4_DIPPU|nr:hypothetical protein L9F63_006760 [Diploptera punctata]
MGKSTELSHLGRKLKKVDQEIWLIRIDLNDHTDFLSQEKCDAFEFLVKAGKFDNTFQRLLLKHHINESGNVVVLIDGFDEISPEYSEKVLIMLKSLLETRISHICVTSRTVMKSMLEQELSTLSFTFNPFTEQDQKEFLLKYWNISQSKHDLNHFIDKLLELTAKSLNDKMKRITGIPLQTKMLAEIFQSAAEHYGKTGECKLPQKLDLLQMYNDFIDGKWNVYCSKNKDDMTKVGVTENNKILREDFLENHMICGLVALQTGKNLQNFNYFRKNTKSKYQNFVDSFQAGHVKTGMIVDMMNQAPVFIHRTFAEFFVAMYFSKHFRYLKPYIERNILKRSNMIRKFFDRMLAQNHKLHVAVLNQDRDEVESVLVDVNETDDGGRTALHLAVMNHFEDFDDNPDVVQKITLLLLERGADLFIKDQVLQWSPLHLSEKIGAWSALEVILQNHEVAQNLVVIPQKIKEDENYLHNILKISSKQGYVHLISYLLSCGVEIGQLFPVTKSKSAAKLTMLHVAARHNQLDLVTFLIEHDADVDARDESYFKRTPLMMAALEGNIEIVKYFLNHANVKVNAQDVRNRTALWYAASRGHAEVVLLLEKSAANIKVIDRNNGYTLLHFAVKFTNLEMISRLRNIAKIINKKNKQSLTPLLMSARNGNWDVFKSLLKRKPNVTVCDKDGNSALHYAAQLGDTAIIKLCVDLQIDVDSKNSRGQTPLLFAAAHKGRLIAIKTLHELGADVSESDFDDNCGLHYAALCDDVEAVDWFVKQNVDLNSENNEMKTPLWLAVDNNNVEAVKKLLELGAEVNITDNINRTPLYIAHRKGNSVLKNMLIEFGASITSKIRINLGTLEHYLYCLEPI